MSPLPRPKRTDPPGLPLPTDPRTWEPWRRACCGHRWFVPPRPQFTEDQQAAAFAAAECVVGETMTVLRLRRFPRARWIDWLCRRAECYARLSKKLRPRLTGPHDREWLRVYMRSWLYSALRRTDPFLADCLPPRNMDRRHPAYPRRRLLAPVAARRKPNYPMNPVQVFIRGLNRLNAGERTQAAQHLANATGGNLAVGVFTQLSCTPAPERRCKFTWHDNIGGNTYSGEFCFGSPGEHLEVLTLLSQGIAKQFAKDIITRKTTHPKMPKPAALSRGGLDRT